MVLFHLVGCGLLRHDHKRDGIININRWRTSYGSSAVLKSPRDCTMLGWSMRRVGLIDITVGNARRLGASQRSATRRCASQHIATQRLSRWGSPAACARLARTGPPQAPLRLGHDASLEQAGAQHSLSPVTPRGRSDDCLAEIAEPEARARCGTVLRQLPVWDL